MRFCEAEWAVVSSSAVGAEEDGGSHRVNWCRFGLLTQVRECKSKKEWLW